MNKVYRMTYDLASLDREVVLTHLSHDAAVQVRDKMVAAGFHHTGYEELIVCDESRIADRIAIWVKLRALIDNNHS